MTGLHPTTSAHPKPIAEISFAERLESLKAGCFGVLSATIAFSTIFLLNQFLVLHGSEFAPLRSQSPLTTAASGAIAMLSGFLFAVTYRYIIRHDRNPHLRSGAVLAFGLVRGLAQLEAELQSQIALLPAVILLGESVALFAIARVVLDWAIEQNWIKPFSSGAAV